MHHLQCSEQAEASQPALLSDSKLSSSRIVILQKPLPHQVHLRPHYGFLHTLATSLLQPAATWNCHAAQNFFSLNGPIREEYDPARPNDYEDIRRARERQRIDAEREAESQEELREQKAVQEVYVRLHGLMQ